MELRARNLKTLQRPPSLTEEVLEPGRVRGHLRLKARCLLCYWATAEVGVKQSRLAEILGLTQPAISFAAKRGAVLAKELNHALED